MASLKKKGSIQINPTKQPENVTKRLTTPQLNPVKFIIKIDGYFKASSNY